MTQFVIAAVPSAGINDDGTALLIRVTDGAGNDLDLVAFIDDIRRNHKHTQ
jgi:hypothetical protein